MNIETYTQILQGAVEKNNSTFVRIGTQSWKRRNFDETVTLQGNIIPEIQSNGNTEMVVGGNFETGLIGTINKTDEVATWAINTVNPITGTKDAYLSVTSAGTNVGRPSLALPSSRVVGQWRKYSFDYKVNSGICKLSSFHRGSTVKAKNLILSGSGTVTDYYLVDGTNNLVFYFDGTNTFNVQIDNVSDAVIGWGGSQELYDGIYAATTGTVEQKTYAAVKAAAMWSNYNNDPALGLVYGKMYNGFAIKLLQMDVDYYNSANATSICNYRFPTQSNFATLSAFLGGNTVSGGKMIEIGTAHWNDPNVGADNSSGFTGLGSGIRLAGSASSNINTYAWYRVSDSLIATYSIRSGSAVFTLGVVDAMNGTAIRCIRV